MNDNNPQGQNGQQNQQIQVKVTDEVLKGVYANMVQVSHGQEEFVLDFMNIFPPQGIISSRVLVSPGHMKRLLAAMAENIKRYEQQFGEIKVVESKTPPATTSSSSQSFGFDTKNAQ